MAVFLSGLRCLYFIFYNWIVFFGWFQVFYFGVKTLKEYGHEYVYDAVEKPLLFAQTAAFLEVRSHILVTSLVISWSITEIIRYSFFGTREAFGSAPYWLLWLRYSTFLLLYPTGIISEVCLIYNALPYMKESGMYSVRMPNKWNFSFDYYYAALVCLAIYVPGKNHNIILLPNASSRVAPGFLAVLTCIVTCLGRERKHSLIQKSIGHRRSPEDYLHIFNSIFNTNTRV